MDDTLEKPQEAHEEHKAPESSDFRLSDFIWALCEFTDPKRESLEKNSDRIVGQERE